MTVAVLGSWGFRTFPNFEKEIGAKEKDLKCAKSKLTTATTIEECKELEGTLNELYKSNESF